MGGACRLEFQAPRERFHAGDKQPGMDAVTERQVDYGKV